VENYVGSENRTLIIREENPNAGQYTTTTAFSSEGLRSELSD